MANRPLTASLLSIVIAMGVCLPRSGVGDRYVAKRGGSSRSCICPGKLIERERAFCRCCPRWAAPRGHRKRSGASCRRRSLPARWCLIGYVR